MNVRSILLLVVALVISGATAFFARSWISAERAAFQVAVPQEEEASATMVLVAKEDLAAGMFVKMENLKWLAWPEDGLSGGYAVKGQREMKDFVGAVVRSAMAAGEPLTEGRVVHPGDRGFLAAVLEAGMRAVSVPVNATTGISGFVFPGDWVDVILTVKLRSENLDGDKKVRHFSETLLKDVRVLAVDQLIEKESGKVDVNKTATLEVSPKQAEKIALSLEMGSLSLSLHSLAREEDRFARLAREMGVKPQENRKRRKPYTMDHEVFYMGSGLLDLGRKGGGRSVTVLRGSEKPEKATF